MSAVLDPVGRFAVRHRVLLAAVALVLAGCASKVAVVAPEPLKPKMPAEVRALCDPLPGGLKLGMSMGDLYEFTDELLGWAGECAARNAAKLQWVESQGL